MSYAYVGDHVKCVFGSVMVLATVESWDISCGYASPSTGAVNIFSEYIIKHWGHFETRNPYSQLVLFQLIRLPSN